MNFMLKSVQNTFLADIETPVSIYLKLRDHYAETLLLEHAEDVHTEGYSYICCDPIASIVLEQSTLTKTFPSGATEAEEITKGENLAEKIDTFRNSFTVENSTDRFSVDGLFGYFNYESINYFENINISKPSEQDTEIPTIRLSIYRYVIVFDHLHHKITIINFFTDEECTNSDTGVIEHILRFRHFNTFPFTLTSEETSNLSDNEYIDIVNKGKEHCFKGDVFQVVLSRQFEVAFKGDEFNVYRSLRSINPSQYLFYFDYGSYRLFGSSPEAQLKINAEKAILHPIAGTYKRTGINVKDNRLALALKKDIKEQAEHVMLVDLARNDLSKTFKKVEVPVFKQIQTFSHVLHMVSEVTGEEPIETISPLKVLADTFPAGTLSGAPKYRAMQLIDEYEKKPRGFYGGCVGYIGFNGDCNQAIMIRSFQSKNNKLYYRAGAGIVAASVPKNELAEVNNKIAALRKAIKTANSF